MKKSLTTPGAIDEYFDQLDANYALLLSIPMAEEVKAVLENILKEHRKHVIVHIRRNATKRFQLTPKPHNIDKKFASV